MTLYFADRSLNILGTITDNQDGDLYFINDSHTEEIGAGIAILSFTVPMNDNNRSDVTALTKAGNYILRNNNNRTEFYTIIERNSSSGRDIRSVYCENAGMDLLNDICDPYEALDAMPIEQYVKMFTYDSGFKLGINEISNLSRKLKWESSMTSTARLLSLATQFDNAEITFEFVIQGLKVVEKKINIFKKIGSDNGIELRVGKELNSIEVKESVAGLLTAVKAKGGTPEGENQSPITLIGFEYDDGDYYLQNGVLKSRTAFNRWSRFLFEKDTQVWDHSGHIIGEYSYDTLSQSELCNRALAYLKPKTDVVTTFEVDIAYLPDGCGLGDRVNVIDAKGDLYLSSRILKIETSDGGRTRVATLGDTLDKNPTLAQKMAETHQAILELPNTIGVAKVITQYYLSTSLEQLVGGEWSDEEPMWEPGYYFWTRTKFVRGDGTVTYSEPYPNAVMNAWYVKANEAWEAGKQAEFKVAEMEKELEESLKPLVDGIQQETQQNTEELEEARKRTAEAKEIGEGATWKAENAALQAFLAYQQIGKTQPGIRYVRNWLEGNDRRFIAARVVNRAEESITKAIQPRAYKGFIDTLRNGNIQEEISVVDASDLLIKVAYDEYTTDVYSYDEFHINDNLFNSHFLSLFFEAHESTWYLEDPISEILLEIRELGTYTFSLSAKGDESGLISIQGISNVYDVSDVWNRYSFTIKVSEPFYLRIESTVNIEFKEMKLEFGSKATPFCPHIDQYAIKTIYYQISGNDTWSTVKPINTKDLQFYYRDSADRKIFYDSDPYIQHEDLHMLEYDLGMVYDDIYKVDAINFFADGRQNLSMIEVSEDKSKWKKLYDHTVDEPLTSDEYWKNHYNPIVAFGDQVIASINISPEDITIEGRRINVDGVMTIMNSRGQSGMTLIDGGIIATNSIFASSLALGDFNNYATVNENYPKSLPPAQYVYGGAINNSVLGYLSKDKATNQYLPLSIIDIMRFNLNDEFYYEFEAYGTANATIRLVSSGFTSVTRNPQGTITGVASASCAVTSGSHTLTTSVQKFTGSIKLNNANVVNAIYNMFAIEDTSTTRSHVYVKNIIIRRKAQGNLIVDGAITATSAIIADGAITNAKIANLDAAKINTGFLAADRIAASSITAEKLTIGLNNLYPNPTCKDTSMPTTNQVSEAGYYSSRCWKAVSTGAQLAVLPYYVIPTFFPKANDEYRVTYWIKSSAALTNTQVQVYFQGNRKDNGSRLDATLVTGTKGIATAANTWTKHTTIQKFSADLTSANLGVYIESSLTAGVTVWISDPEIVLAAGSQLIVDGSIVASKIAANSLLATHVGTTELIASSANIKDGIITNAKIANLDAAKITTGTLEAGRIAAYSITADKIDANAINGKTITGATIQTTTVPLYSANTKGLRLSAPTDGSPGGLYTWAPASFNASRMTTGYLSGGTFKVTGPDTDSGSESSITIERDQIVMSNAANNYSLATEEFVAWSQAYGGAGYVATVGTGGQNVWMRILYGTGTFENAVKKGSYVHGILYHFTGYEGSNSTPYAVLKNTTGKGLRIGDSNDAIAEVTAAVYTTSSDRKIKKDIISLDDKHETLFNDLKPVSYKLRNGSSGRTHLGFIAQDVEKSMEKAGLDSMDFAGFCKAKDMHPRMERRHHNGRWREMEVNDDVWDGESWNYFLRYEEFISLNTHMIQKLQQRVKELENRLGGI